MDETDETDETDEMDELHELDVMDSTDEGKRGNNEENYHPEDIPSPTSPPTMWTPEEMNCGRPCCCCF